MIFSVGKILGIIFLLLFIIILIEEEKEKFNSEDGFNVVMIECVCIVDGEFVVYCIDKFVKEILLDLLGYNEELLLMVIYNNMYKCIIYVVVYIELIGYYFKILLILECEFEIVLFVLK